MDAAVEVFARHGIEAASVNEIAAAAEVANASAPEWSRALVRAVWYLPDLRRQVSAYARADIERGVRAGSFKVEVDDLLVDLFASLVVTAVFLRLEGEAGPDAGAHVAEHQLQMLGVPPARAKRVAWRDLEALAR